MILRLAFADDYRVLPDVEVPGYYYRDRTPRELDLMVLLIRATHRAHSDRCAMCAKPAPCPSLAWTTRWRVARRRAYRIRLIALWFLAPAAFTVLAVALAVTWL